MMLSRVLASRRLVEASERATVGVVLVMAAGIVALSLVSDDAGLRLLLAVPVALCALRFGLTAGIVSALIGVGLIAAWGTQSEVGDGVLALGAQAGGLLLVGLIAGAFTEHGRSVRDRLRRQQELSLDLICTANYEGYFTRLNPAWRRTLGYQGDELLARPFLDFVHPDDREATIEEARRQTEAGEEVLRFENRYRHFDGSYRWLEWTSRPDPQMGELIAVARDITARKQAEETIRRYQEMLEAEVAERTRDLEEARFEILQRLALAAEYRDDDTYEHTERVATTAAALTKALGLPEREVSLIRQAAPLHDVGKLGISDALLLKPGRLTPEEFELVKTHALLGAKILSGSKSDVLQLAERIALTHHEWWDGSGYPYQLRDEEIPQCGRIVALADVFDALTHERPYKIAWPVEQAIDEIHRLRERQFDPDVVDAFDTLDPRSLAGASTAGSLNAAA